MLFDVNSDYFYLSWLLSCCMQEIFQCYVVVFILFKCEKVISWGELECESKIVVEWLFKFYGMYLLEFYDKNVLLSFISVLCDNYWLDSGDGGSLKYLEEVLVL